MMNKILIVVDFQNDFVSGSLGSEQAKAIVPKVKAKIEEYAKRGDFIIFTRDTHYEDYLETQEGKYLRTPHCISGTEGWGIFDNLDRNVSEYNKMYVNKMVFGYNKWEMILPCDFNKSENEIEIVGLCTDICVVSNALILKTVYPEVKVTVDASCCAGVTEESHKAALLTMKMCQINVIND